jgi:hypothetical protein
MTMEALRQMPRFQAAVEDLARRMGCPEACTLITAAVERIALHEDLGPVGREILLMRLDKPLP